MLSASAAPDGARAGDGGASAVEYCLLVAGIAAVIVLLVFAFGGYVGGLFEDTCDSVAAAGSSVSSATCAP